MYNPDHTGLPDPALDAQFYENVATKRLLAWIVDVLISVVITLAIGFMTFGLLLFFYFPILFGVSFLYRFISISSGSATWGMRLFGIELRNAQGNRFASADAFMHTFLFFIVNVSVVGLLINAAMMLLGERGQGLHDYVMGSTAINRPADF